MEALAAATRIATAIVAGAAVIAAALVYQGHRHRYEVTANGTAVYRIDTVTGSVSACGVLGSDTDGPVTISRVFALGADAWAKYSAEHMGQTICTPWSQ